MEELLNSLVFGMSFYQTLLISMGVFFADWISGIIAALRSGRRIKSSIMRQSLTKKASGFFHYLILGLSFYCAHLVGNHGYAAELERIAAVIVLVPAIPEILSLFENVKIARTQIDTKPKEEGVE